MLSNGWYWSGRGHEVMAYPIVGWEVRCRWEELPSGRWALRMTVREEDPAPWLPEELEDPATVTVRPEIDGRSEWGSPDPKAMEEALRKSLTIGYTSVSSFMHFSGLKRDSAQKFLDSLCQGEDARLRRRRNGKSYIYSPRTAKALEQK